MHDAYNGHFKVNLLLLKIFINDLACPDSKQPASTHSTSIATPSAMPRQAGPGAPCYKRVNGCRVRQQKRKSRPHERCRTGRRQPPATGHPCGHKRRQKKPPSVKRPSAGPPDQPDAAAARTEWWAARPSLAAGRHWLPHRHSPAVQRAAAPVAG